MGQEGEAGSRSFPRAVGSKQHKLVFLLKQQKPTLSPSGDQKSESRGRQGHAASNISRGASCLPLPTVWRPQQHLAPLGWWAHHSCLCFGHCRALSLSCLQVSLPVP